MSGRKERKKEIEMVKRKRRRTELEKDIVGGIAPAFIVGGGAIGSSILGGALQSRLPAGTANPLTQTGTTLGTFTGPIAVIGVTGIVTKQLRRAQPKFKRKRRKGGI